MFCKGCLFYILAFSSFTYAVKVNMHGSLSLGKEVMDTLNHYLMRGYGISGRRSMDDIPDDTIDSHPAVPNESIPFEVRSASLCRDLDMCSNGFDKFVDEYVTALGRAVETVFEGIFSERTRPLNITIYTRLKGVLHDARKVLKTASSKISDDREAYVWVGVLKKLSSSFQTKSVSYVIEGLDADKDVNLIKKKLTQKLVISIAAAEARAEKTLCLEYHVCLKTLECSESLNFVLKRLNASPNDKMKKFLKSFFDVMATSNFYLLLDEVTANEFKDILNDMAFFDNVPAKDILVSFQQTVQMRLDGIKSKVDVENGSDIQLVHIILSDMDYIYNKQRGAPFNGFLDRFSDWTKTGGKITSHVKEVMKNIKEALRDTSDDIIVKLIGEVRVFLEITVDP